jgi:5-methylcytosine-specific restriction enzyme A
MTPRPCLTCGRLTSSGTRCTRCATAVSRAKRVVRPYTAAEKRRRAAAVAEWRATYGDVCPGWGDREPHPSADLTADHIVAVAAGGAEDGPLTVRCRACNSARGARP